MTFDELIAFGKLMMERSESPMIAVNLAREYKQMADIVDELVASREHFGAVADARFLRG